MINKIVEEKDIRKHELYTELKEEFDKWHVCLALRPNAAPEWWAPADGVEDEAFFEAQANFTFVLAGIVAKYINTDDEHAFAEANILVQCELNSIRTYADRLQDRMYDLELANYTREKFLNDLIDAVENEFGVI